MVRRQPRQARGDVDLYLNVSDLPANGASRALAHHLGNDPVLRVAGLTDSEIRRHVGEITKGALATLITESVEKAIRRARGRVD